MDLKTNKRIVEKVTVLKVYYLLFNETKKALTEKHKDQAIVSLYLRDVRHQRRAVRLLWREGSS